MDKANEMEHAHVTKGSNALHATQPEAASSGVPQIIVTDGPKEPNPETPSPAIIPPTIARDSPQPLQSSQEGHDSKYLPRTSESAGAGSVVPSSIKYTLVTNLAQSKTRDTHPNDLKVSLHDPDSYQKIAERAEDIIKDVHKEKVGEKDLLFRYGNCTLSNEKEFRSRLPLRSPEEWKEVCNAILDYQAGNVSDSLNLVVFREYALCQHRAPKAGTLAAEKRKDIYALIKPAWGGNVGKSYIPHTDLSRVILPSMVPEIVNEVGADMDADQKDDFIRKVQSKGMILLAMWICECRDLRLSCIRKILNTDYCDAKLPDKPLSDKDLCCHTGQCDQDFNNALVEKQGIYVAAKFKPGDRREFHRHTVVPLHFYPRNKDNNDTRPDKDRAFCGEGSYSKVYRVRLDPNHHMLARDKDASFALKEFRNRPSQVCGNFTHELSVLTELRDHDHPHIMTHLATWTQDEAYYMLFPYAQCNLREYMRDGKFGGGKEDVLWLLEQFKGLASALKKIHGLTDEQSPMLQPPTQGAIQRERRAGWHHDIKPENILFSIYRHTNPPRKLFQISDWGSGKINTIISGTVNTNSPTGTPTYEPPEFIIEGRTSRPYDVWSLGCVFLELLVWALVNFDAVEKLKKDRVDRRDLSAASLREDDAFWQKSESKGIVLRKAVLDCISDLEDCIQRRQRLKAFRPVVELIKAMLNINRGGRITAFIVEATLARICSTYPAELEDSNPATTDDDPAIPRSSMKAPETQPPEDGKHVSSSPLDIYSGHGLHSRDISATGALSPHPVSRSQNTSNASSTMSLRNAESDPSKASSPEAVEEPDSTGQA